MSLLPSPVRAALDLIAEGRGRSALAESSQRITAGYRARRNSSVSLASDEDALAYALARMPATYAATIEALGRLSAAMPDFEPRRMLDVGCGPGTASFAAAEAFASLEAFTLIDRNGPFLRLAEDLVRTALPNRSATVGSRDITAAGSWPEADLVVAAYVLAELPAERGRDLAAGLWRASAQALVLVEPGTPDGFARLRAIRTDLIAQGAVVAAPCTHEAACPMGGDAAKGEAWCRFFARVQRSRDHRLLKGGERPFEDEPYAYLALTRATPQRRASHRIVARPQVWKGGVSLGLCGQDGLTKHEVASRDRERFKAAKGLRWGDEAEIPAPVDS